MGVDRAAGQPWRVPVMAAMLLVVSALAAVALPSAPLASARSGLVHEYRIAPPGQSWSRPTTITTGPDGRLWFAEGYLSAVTTSGTISRYAPPMPVLDVTSGPGGDMWAVAADSTDHAIVRMSTTGVVEATHPLPEHFAAQDAVRIAAGPDGNLWYSRPGFVGRMTPAGDFTEFELPDRDGNPSSWTQPGDIVAGSDGALWFGSNGGLGRITTDGQITFREEVGTNLAVGLGLGPDGSLWFATGTSGGNVIGRVTPAGTYTTYSSPQDVSAVAVAPGGDVWYVGPEGVGTMTPGGAFLDRDLSGSDVVAGPDGHMWVTRWWEGTILEFDTAPDPTGEFTAVTPQRILDTRDGTGQGGVAGPVAGGSSIRVAGTGVGGVPTSGVSAVVLNATVTGPTHGSYLTVWPTGAARPEVSNLNFVPGQTVPNLVTVAVGQGGTLDVYNAVGSTHVVFDIVGFYATGSGPLGSRFRDVPPFRLFDTRSGTGGVPRAPIGAGGNVRVPVPGRGGVPPAGVTAVVMNVTVTEPTASGYVTVFPGDVARPLASNLNFVPGQTIPNLVTVRVPADGTIEVFNAVGSTHLLADVVGYYTADVSTGEGRFVPVTPARLFDTREDEEPFGAWRELFELWAYYPDVDIDGASAAVLNVTVTDPTAAGYVTVYPSDTCPTPFVSNLNFVAGQTVPNLVITGLSTAPGCDVASPGSFTIYNAVGETDIIADLFGYFTVSADTVR